MYWLICATALVLALAAWQRARALARRLERVKQLQWELSHQVEELTARLDAQAAGGRADGGGTAGRGGSSAATGVPDSGGTAFVPLSSVRR